MLSTSRDITRRPRQTIEKMNAGPVFLSGLVLASFATPVFVQRRNRMPRYGEILLVDRLRTLSDRKGKVQEVVEDVRRAIEP